MRYDLGRNERIDSFLSSDDRLPGESMLKKITGYGGDNRKQNLRQYWIPDSVGKECHDCGEKFTPFRRRHHCTYSQFL
ncbi:unnamed protein product [Didymodactylos carnosus]|uniref:FYVE zinc finger domain-containing protein n=1 Tax=Didymodactylos carnosus TaxID=1234261 RepID=A0A815U6F6_9BILA|nr:unnamed protein product [Didymodactylos carnosus]CAF4375496.1 unnamed protein product [Didymodactylos carnosus]